MASVFSSAAALAQSTWDPATPAHISVAEIDVQGIRYQRLVAGFSSVLSYQTTGPRRPKDVFNPANAQLTLAQLTVSGQTFFDVTVQLTHVVSVGSSLAIAPLLPTDPLFGQQWHLRNLPPSQLPGVSALAGADVNASAAWPIATGKGIRLAVVDTGLDTAHEDLRTVTNGHWDYRTDSSGDPSSSTAMHGTAVAGIAAAVAHNFKGGVGVAFDAELVGYNLLASKTSLHSADAMTRGLSTNHIYINSYGSEDGTGAFSTRDEIWSDAIQTGVTLGRGGKGAIYVWAAGNGAPTDRTDYEEPLGHPGVITVGALNATDQRASYSEEGANLLVSAYSGEYCSSHAITTTDTTGISGFNSGQSFLDLSGQPNYTRCMNGTSAATPQVAGVAALMLEANPQLSARDVRHILATTARRNDPNHRDWTTNGAGLHVNHSYGFGVVDALAAVQAAQIWSPLPAQRQATASARLTTPQPLPDAGPALTSTLYLGDTGMQRIEHVTLNITSNHPDVGHLRIALTSPSGTTNTVTVPHTCKDYDGNAASCGDALTSGFAFGISRLLNENPTGTWTLSVQDATAGQTGDLLGWSLSVLGN